jgi:hypothetical protein
MIAKCAGQQNNVNHSIWPILGNSYCECGVVKWPFYMRCALCSIKESAEYKWSISPPVV